MKLYKFISAKWGLEAIKLRRLKISRILELNDPFELLAPVLDDEVERSVTLEWKRKMSDKFGMLCMSLTWQNPLLWGHYADSHQGICLGFTVLNEAVFEKVEYVRSRPTLNSLDMTSVKGMNEATMKRLLRMKFDAWSYEAELRCFLRLENSIDGNYFVDFSPTMTLSEVIVGSSNKVRRAEVTAAVGDLENVDCFLARTAFKKFEVVRQRNEAIWH